VINYGLIQQSIDFYDKSGFNRVETPWTVTKAVSDITRPESAKEFRIENKDKVLVASAEQGFLYLYLKGFLPKGRFQSVSPCFRDESFDKYHTKYFIKNELIQTDKTDEKDLEEILIIATKFFEEIVPDKKKLTYKTGEYATSPFPNYDILYDGIELGSYGIRECSYLRWIYGTGLAEPRFTAATKKYD
jgi:seryl-tRNA synthetase